MPRDEWKRAREKAKARRADYELATDDTILTFGKFAGERLGDLPSDYLVWLATNCQFSPHSNVQAILRWIDEHSDRLAQVPDTLNRRPARKRKNIPKPKKRLNSRPVKVNEALVNSFSWESVLWFGRYSGCRLADVPGSYLLWLPKSIGQSKSERVRAVGLWVAREATRKQIGKKLKRERANT